MPSLPALALQAAAVAFGEQLPIPEIVAIGGQSDGKSSLLEAFLGVRNRRGEGGGGAGQLAATSTPAARGCCACLIRRRVSSLPIPRPLSFVSTSPPARWARAGR